MSKELSLLFENIEEHDVKESIELLLFTSKMIDCNIKVRYVPLSFFTISIITFNKEHSIELHFNVNARKKYLISISLDHKYDFNVHGYNKSESSQSGHIAPNFMLPLEKAMNILVEY